MIRVLLFLAILAGPAYAGPSIVGASCSSCVLLTEIQTISGQKTFSGGVSLTGLDNGSGVAGGTALYIGLTDGQALFIDGSVGDVYGIISSAHGNGVAGDFSGGTGVGALALRASSGGSNRNTAEFTGDGTGSALRLFPGSSNLTLDLSGAATNRISSATTAVNASATIGAFTLKAANALDAADLVLDVESSTGGHLATVDQSGLVASGAASGSIAFQTATGAKSCLVTGGTGCSSSILGVGMPQTDQSADCDNAATGNAPTGKVCIQAGQGSMVLTNSSVFTTSIVMLTNVSDDTTCLSGYATVGNGSVTIGCVGAGTATANTVMQFTVFNP